MPSMLDTTERARMLQRLAAIAPETRPRWGMMSAAQMLAHLDAQMRDVLGELTVAPRPRQIRNPLLKWFLIDVMPWPKGKLPTAPEYRVASPGEFAPLAAGLRARLEAWAALGEARGGAVHPLFGPLSGATLGRLLWKHWNHHLEQFGA
ncbi:MAG: hypothetical protein ABIU54_04615 [Candidatus Eisenbacteria bacterium]